MKTDTRCSALIALALSLFTTVLGAQPKNEKPTAAPRDFNELIARTEFSERHQAHIQQLKKELGPLLERIPIQRIDGFEERGVFLDLVLRDNEPCKIKIP